MRKRYLPIELAGFAFFVEEGCFERHPKLCARMEGDLAEVERVLPQKAVALLRERCAIWVNDVLRYPDGETISGLLTHWGSWYPLSKADLAEKGGSVEVCQAKHYLQWAPTQPAMLLHELAHCYHYHCRDTLGPIVQQAYEEHGGAQGSAVQPAQSPAEFFAEASEAFFSSSRFRAGFFPYTHCELKSCDPVAFAMCEAAWQVAGDDVASRTEFPADWLAHFTRVPEDELRACFEGADRNGDGTLPSDEFLVVASQIVPGLSACEVEAAWRNADANRDDTIDFKEFVAWVRAQAADT